MRRTIPCGCARPPSLPSRIPQGTDIGRPATACAICGNLTPARVGLGRAGASLPTKALLEFTLDHARARDAVHAAFDAAGLMRGLADLGLEAMRVSSQCARAARTISAARISGASSIRIRSKLLAGRRGSRRLAIIIGDGLSPAAVNAHAIEALAQAASAAGGDAIEIGHAVVATGARVALGDEIGDILGARMTVMLIGERPGLSAADSLGVYLTFAPTVGTTDEKRNCVSNIHGAGLGYEEAAVKIGMVDSRRPRPGIDRRRAEGRKRRPGGPTHHRKFKLA